VPSRRWTWRASRLTDDVVAFEMDLEGRPVRLGSRDDAVRYAEEIFAQVKKMGANSTLAYCTVEFDFKATMADGSTLVQPSRNSVVLRQGDDGWKWTHWHALLAVLPAPPALPPAP